MVDYRNILRLKSLDCSNVEIAAGVHCSRTTVIEVLKLAEALHISWPLGNDVSNRELESMFYPNRYRKEVDRLEPDFPKIHKELAKKGVTLSLLWTEYCIEAEAAGKKPYMSTQFNEKYHKWAQVSKATMRISRKPGEFMEVDWAGATIPIFDQDTGLSWPAYLFVGVLSCSDFTYAEICNNTDQHL